MINELSNKIIYDDFIEKVILTEEEEKILKMMVLKYSIVKMSQEMAMSERNISRLIKIIKEKYDNYRAIEMAKISIFNA